MDKVYPIVKTRYFMAAGVGQMQHEIEHLREGCHTPMENALLEFFYSTGCRIGEVAKLNREDINCTGNSVIEHGKGDKEREVYFNIRCSIWLKRYLENLG